MLSLKKARAPVTYYYVSEQTHVPEAPYEATVIFDKRGTYWSWKTKATERLPMD